MSSFSDIVDQALGVVKQNVQDFNFISTKPWGQMTDDEKRLQVQKMTMVAGVTGNRVSGYKAPPSKTFKPRPKRGLVKIPGNRQLLNVGSHGLLPIAKKWVKGASDVIKGKIIPG